MAAETAKQVQLLEATTGTLMSVFTRDGFEPVAPAIIQPAGVFLDVVGETLRARTYVFTDPDGDELCLRPDLTVPACRLHLERDPSAAISARYSYNGPAFRFQPKALITPTPANSARRASNVSAKKTASRPRRRSWARLCARSKQRASPHLPSASVTWAFSARF